MKPLKILLPTVAAVGAATAVAVGSIPGSDDVIHGCYYSRIDGSKPYGTLRVIDPSDTSGNLDVSSCVTDESAITWNQEGPTGPQGIEGLRGPRGPKGAPGTGLTIASPTIKPTATPIGEVKIGKLSFDVLSVGLKRRGGGTTSGKVKFNDISILKKTDKSSSALFKACTKGKHFDKVTIVARKAGGGQQEFVKYTLHDVVIGSFQTLSTGGESSKPEESITFNFSKVEIKY